MLTSKDRQHLKNLAHAQKPVVLIGKKGFTDALHTEIHSALLAHQLIKIKFLEAAIDIQEEMIDKLCIKLEAELVESRGHIVTLYRLNPERPNLL